MTTRGGQSLTFGSLFAGIGGMDLGLERAGLECRWQVEIDPFARRVLAKHWPDVPRHDDVRTFPPEGEDLERYRVDLVAGGFPCQDISYAGRGAGLAGERSGLWYEFARVIRDLRPRFVLVENVAALLVRGLDAVLGTLASLGYDAEWGCIPAAAVGAPHLRERVFIVAYSEQGRRMVNQGKPVAPRLGQSANQTRTYWQSKTVVAFDRNETDPQGGAPCKSGRGYQDGEIGPLGACQWEPEPQLDRVVDGLPSRMDLARIGALGNAIVPQVAEWIGRRLIAAFSEPCLADAATPLFDTLDAG